MLNDSMLRCGARGRRCQRSTIKRSSAVASADLGSQLRASLRCRRCLAYGGARRGASPLTFRRDALNPNPKPWTAPCARRTQTCADYVQRAAKVITLVDLAGHEKYFRTTAYGLTGEP